METIIGGVVVAVLVLVAFFVTAKRLWVNASPNEAAIFTGAGESKVLVGGGKLRVPFFEQVEWVPLQNKEIALEVNGVFSEGNVPVEVRAIALVRVPNEEDMIRTAAGQSLNEEPERLTAQIREALQGVMREIIASMSVEDLNSRRDHFAAQVVEKAGGEMRKLGHVVTILNIQNIRDDVGYLEALGVKQIAIAKRDASIASAEADREAREKVADANRKASEAEFIAQSQVAESESARDIRKALARANAEREQATAEKAAPLASARADLEVGQAVEAARAAREEAALEYERKRTERVRQSQEAETIVPAEAAKQAMILEAEGQAEKLRREGDAERDSRTSVAAGVQAEMVADAAGHRAKLEAEAAGQAKLADALRKFDDQAMRLQIIPQIIAVLPQVAAELSKPISAVDNITIVSGGGDNGDHGMFGGLLGQAPITLARVVEIGKAVGLDIPALLNGAGTTTTTTIEGDVRDAA